MTLAELNAKVAIGVIRDDITDTGEAGGNYYEFINEAQRTICQMRSWQFMKTQVTVTITAGENSVALPEDFKEFTKTTTPVHVIVSETETPIDIWTPEKHKRFRGRQLLTNAVMHLDDTVDPKELNTIDAMTTDTDFTVRYYAMPADLSDPTDTNKLTELYPYMLINLAKSLAFQTVNDPAAADAEAIFQGQFARASRDDAFRQLAGTDLHM